MNMKLLLSATFVAGSLLATAQDGARTYAITGKADNKYFWADIKEVDISSGKVVRTLFEADKTPFTSVSQDKTVDPSRPAVANPTGFGAAACALDTRHNRLYFAPMHFSDIIYLDLGKKAASFTTIKKNVIPNSAVYQSEENQLTRMAIAADGYGYAISNDGNHLIRFSTGKRATVEDLGNLVDAESNKGISIHNKCTSWGGDMVADAFGKLVVITASHNVFEIDVNTRIATHLGAITGLPATFTTNAAVVDNDGLLVVSSANVLESLYKVNMKDLKAIKVEGNEAPFNASDMANGILLNQKKADAANQYASLEKPVMPVVTPKVEDNKVYPNPVTGSVFNVLFDGRKAGRYTIVLADIAGRAIQSKVVNVISPNQSEAIRLATKTAKGMYMVKVMDEKGQLTFSEKIVIE